VGRRQNSWRAFCNVFKFRDGRISSLRIYLDPDGTGEDQARFRWVAGRPAEAPAYAGTDFIIARDGRIATQVESWGPVFVRAGAGLQPGRFRRHNSGVRPLAAAPSR